MIRVQNSLEKNKYETRATIPAKISIIQSSPAPAEPGIAFVVQFQTDKTSANKRIAIAAGTVLLIGTTRFDLTVIMMQFYQVHHFICWWVIT